MNTRRYRLKIRGFIKRSIIFFRSTVFDLKNLKIAIFAFVWSFYLTGCRDKNINTMDTIELRNGTLRAAFVMPAAYRVERGDPDYLMAFVCEYPSMQPRDPNGIPQDDEIAIFITLLKDSQSKPEYMVGHAADHFNSKRPGQVYRAGKQGPYDLYRSELGNQIPPTEVITYVFRAKDGALVGVKDPGSWSVKYEIDRKIGADLHVRYLISKPIGSDFIKIDEVATAFINAHQKIKSRDN
jgi:hypothetical protein